MVFGSSFKPLDKLHVSHFLPHRHRPIQREFVSDIIANKREIFLAEYVLQTKRQSLTKLQEKATLAERELNVSENKLEQDACMFDEFLRQTDKSAVDAMHEAERISQIRQNLTDQEKKLKLQCVQKFANNLKNAKIPNLMGGGSDP